MGLAGLAHAAPRHVGARGRSCGAWLHHPGAGAGALAGSQPGLRPEDQVPDVAEHAVTRIGDIWCAGDHRLSCGSCTDDGAVKALFTGSNPHLMVTDPPYGVDYDPGWRHRAGVNQSSKTAKIRNDK